MSNKLENSNTTEKPTAYRAIGLSIFLICFGFSYLMPNIFPEGSLFIIAGTLILLTNLVKSFKGIGYDGLEVLFGIVFLLHYTSFSQVIYDEIKSNIASHRKGKVREI